MSDAFWIYLFVKLDDIKHMLTGPGMTLLSLILLAIYALIIYPISTGKKHEDEIKAEQIEKYGKTHKVDTEDIWARGVSKVILKCLIIWICVMMLEVGLNGLAVLLPSTGQAAAIYLGVQAKNSETVQTLSKLPSKYAKILEYQADRYVCDTAVKTFGKDNLPNDIKEMCNVKDKKDDNGEGS